MESLQEAARQLSSRLLSEVSESLRLATVESRLAKIEDQLQRILRGPIRLSVQSFAPEPYELIRQLEVVLEPNEDEYLATFFDANISTAGENEHEALENLKSLILDVYELLERTPAEELGPEPAHQLTVLRQFIQPT